MCACNVPVHLTNDRTSSWLPFGYKMPTIGAGAKYLERPGKEGLVPNRQE